MTAAGCPACSITAIPGTIFCEECGTTLALVPPPSAVRLARAPVDVPAAPRRTVGITGDIVVPSVAAAAPSQASPQLRDTLSATPTASDDRAALWVRPDAAGVDWAQTGPTTPVAYLISEQGRRVEVPARDVVIVGREDMRSGIRPEVDLTLDGASTAGVSRRHCRLLRSNGDWQIEDLRSTNRTLLNGKPLRPHSPVDLHHGDEVRLGRLILRFHAL